MANLTKRLSADSYKKTDKTYQETLSTADIQDKLDDYERVDDISKVSLNTHIRYFVMDKKTNKRLFRLGGFLSKLDTEKGYLILSNGNKTWSVQLPETIFFKKLSIADMKGGYITQIQKLEDEVKGLKDLIKEIKRSEKKRIKNI
jgi:hypothetical protein